MNPPIPRGETGWRALRALIQQRNMLAALQALHTDLGDVFALPVPAFSAVTLVGPAANRFVMTQAGDALRWRIERDPLARLLRHGFLVEDGESHDELRALVDPAFHRRAIPQYVERMWQHTDRITATWHGRPLDLLPELRRLALDIIADTLFGRDVSRELDRLWGAVLKTVAYISPGLWMLYPDLPRPGYARARAQLDTFLYGLIAARRASLTRDAGDDVLGWLVRTPDLSADLIRDQLLTLLIAGHDTTTALLAWTVYLLGKHPAAMQRACAEVERVLGHAAPSLDNVEQLAYLDRVIKETLRLYPPIHIGNRLAARDLEFEGYSIPAGTRVLYSIYLTHRDARYFPSPACFDPDRFDAARPRTWPPYAYVPFGGGPRVCIGAAFAQVEAKVVLARLLQSFDLSPASDAPVRPRMRATLEPSPGVWMRVRRKAQAKQAT